MNKNYRLTFCRAQLRSLKNRKADGKLIEKTSFIYIVISNCRMSYVKLLYTRRIYDTVTCECHRDSRGKNNLRSRNSLTSSRDFIEIYKESVPDRTKITVGFGTTGVHVIVYACVVTALSFHVFFLISPFSLFFPLSYK